MGGSFFYAGQGQHQLADCFVIELQRTPSVLDLRECGKLNWRRTQQLERVRTKRVPRDAFRPAAHDVRVGEIGLESAFADPVAEAETLRVKARAAVSNARHLER